MVKNQNKKINEPSVVIKPIGKLGGLDGIHIILILLLIISLAILLYVTYAKQSIVLISNQTTTNQTLNLTNCEYGYSNNYCATPIHNASQIKKIFESFLASYTYINSSLSVVPYISEVNQIKEYYSPNTKTWIVTVPEKYFITNTTFILSAIINDSNTSQIFPLIQTIKPVLKSQNYVYGYGYISLSNKTSCITSNSTPLYWFIDPYSPGSISSLSYLEKLQNKFNNTISPEIDILYTQYSQTVADQYGLQNTTLMGKYIFCSSKQPNFNTFINTLNSSYQNEYMSPNELNQIAKNSELNLTQINQCISSSSVIINRQAVLANYYNITSTPSVIIGCKYETIPQMSYQTLCSIKNISC
ncbi:MAG: hypothetical protein QXD23_02190 [Candidatus Micrarchaeaceae archaeon]